MHETASLKLNESFNKDLSLDGTFNTDMDFISTSWYYWYKHQGFKYNSHLVNVNTLISQQ